MDTPLRIWAAMAFQSAGKLSFKQRHDGELEIDRPHTRFNNIKKLRMVEFGEGPFCKFNIPSVPYGRGLYVLAGADKPVYAGKTIDMRSRWGPVNYGSIQPRNCFVGGQPTNVRVNHFIARDAANGIEFELFCHMMPNTSPEDLGDAEIKLIKELRPPWNRAGV